MKTLLKKYIFHLITLETLALLSLGLTLHGNLAGILYSALIMFILITLIKPFLDVILFPIYLISLNMVNWIIYILIINLGFLITSYLELKPLYIEGFQLGAIMVNSFRMGILGTSILISVVYVIIFKILNWLCK